MEATIFNIQRFSLHDGPGIRTLIFFKGCPLRCAWCSNPESQRLEPALMYNKRTCIGCRTCLSSCALNLITESNGKLCIDREKCTACGECAEKCPANALHIAGETMDEAALLEQALKDKPYFQMSGGGITLSGGEPLLQIDSCVHLLGLLKERGIHTAVETCGFADNSAFARVLPLVDLFMFDYKLHDPAKHKKYVGVENQKILDNLRWLHGHGANIHLRAPLIPGINMDDGHYRGICELVNELQIKEVELLPFHQYGRSKYQELDMDYACDDVVMPTTEDIDAARENIAAKVSAAVR